MHDCFVIYSYVVHVQPFGNEPFVFFKSKGTTFPGRFKKFSLLAFRVLQIGIFKYLIIFDKNHAFEG